MARSTPTAPTPATRGEILGSIGAELWGGFAHLLAGNLREAIEALDRAHERELLWGTKLDAVMAYSSAFLTQAWVERGDPVRAREMSDRMADVAGFSDGARFWLVCRGALLIAEGNPEAALQLTERVASLHAPQINPVWAPWRSVQARALAALGRNEEANAIALEELALTERTGAPWAVGRVHRLLAQIGGAQALAHARQAVALLSKRSARLELAKGESALGEHLAAAGDRAGAVAALRRALDGARISGARRAGRPRRVGARPSALSPAARRGCRRRSRTGNLRQASVNRMARGTREGALHELPQRV